MTTSEPSPVEPTHSSTSEDGNVSRGWRRLRPMWRHSLRLGSMAVESLRSTAFVICVLAPFVLWAFAEARDRSVLRSHRVRAGVHRRSGCRHPPLVRRGAPVGGGRGRLRSISTLPLCRPRHAHPRDDPRSFAAAMGRHAIVWCRHLAHGSEVPTVEVAANRMTTGGRAKPRRAPARRS